MINNNTLVSGNSVGRVNNLLSRMLENRSATTAASSGPVQATNLRCNLFGIRLDHDQLKQEMNSLLQEQLDIQQNKWGFDFENAQPLMKSSNIKWKKCIVKRDENNTDVIDQAENNRRFLPIMMNDDIELGSSVPQFYQTQRKYKLAENKNKVNQMNVVIKPEAKLIVKSKDCEPTASTAPTVIKTKQTKLKFNDENSSRSQVETTKTSSPAKPATSSSARKPRSLKRLDSTVRIITYSENRKDTLRSATRSTSSHSKAPITTTTTTTTIQTNVRLSASVQSLPQATKSAFSTPSSKQTQSTDYKPTMKQSSLLDMLKQKKRRQVNTNSTSKDVNKSNESTTTSGHFLRSHSASTTSRT